MTRLPAYGHPQARVWTFGTSNTEVATQTVKMGRLRVGSYEYNVCTLQADEKIVGSLDWLEHVLHVSSVDIVSNGSWGVQLKQLELLYHKSKYSMYDLDCLRGGEPQPQSRVGFDFQIKRYLDWFGILEWNDLS